MSNGFTSRLFIVGILLFFSFGFFSNTFAQNVSPADLINAEILSNIWFSKTVIGEGDTINIYAGFQNHSVENLSGVAGFYVDDLEIKKVDFTSNSKSLIKLETTYVAVAGNHNAQVKILNIDNLLATETEKKDFSVNKPATPETILEKAAAVANTVANTANQYADTLANYVESFKTPTENSPDSIGTTLINKAKDLIPGQNKNQGKTQEKVLGASTGDTPNSPTIKKETEKFPFYNPFIDIAVFLIHQWVWILGGILLFIIYSIFKKK